MKKLTLLSYFYSLLILIALSALPSMAQVQVPIGTGTSGSTTLPFIGTYGGSKTQMIFTADEIIANGGSAGALSSIAFNMTANTATSNELLSFTVRVQNTELTVFTAFIDNGWTEVYNGTYTLGAIGWQTINFQTPFTWNGTSNLVFEICWANNVATRGGGTTVQYTSTGTGVNRTRNINQDSRSTCAAITGAGTNSINRPNVVLGLIPIIPYISANPYTLNFNYVEVEGMSAVQTINIGGGNLTPASGSISLTPSAGFQVSVDNGTTWVSTPTSINYSGASIATPIPVKVRFNPQLEQAYAGTLTIEGGTATRVVNLSGTSILTYCTPTITGTTGLDIARINVGSFDNSSQATTPLLSNTASNQTYNDFRATAPVLNLQAGTTVPYSFNVITSYTYTSAAYMKVYVDLNRDAVIDPVTERVDSLYFTSALMTSNNGLFTSNLNIPPNAAVGQNTLIRFLLTTTAATQPCGSYANGETEDYWVNLSQAPPYVLATPSSLQFGYVAAEEYSLPQTINIGGGNLNPATGTFYLTPSEGFQVSTDNGTTWSTEASIAYVGNPIATPIPVMVRFNPQEVLNYTGTLTIEGGGVTRLVDLVGTSILTYCTSTATNTADDDIGNVTISQNGNILLNNGTALPSLNNTSSTNLYSDYTTSIPAINLQGANQYQLSISQINEDTFYSCAIKVYIDYNVNGTFDLPQELAFTATTVAPTNANTPNTYTGVINVPPTVNTSGAANARMRVVIDEFDVAPACGTYSYGETEDYLVHFLAPPPYVMASVANNDFGVVLPGTQSASKDITIQAGTLTPASGNLTVTPSANFQISLDSITWSNAPLTVAYTNSGATVTPTKVKVRFIAPTALGLGFAGTVTVSGANAQTPSVVNLAANNMQTYPASSVSATSTTDTIDIAKVTVANLAFGEATLTPITGRSAANKKYTDNRLTAPELSLNAGSTYQYTVNTYTTGAAMPLCSLGVYIDYNADGDFSDAGESASTVAIPAANNGVVTASFTVPATAKIDTNNSPRIRFVLSTSSPSATSTTYTVGETEDYRLRILPRLPFSDATVANNSFGVVLPNTISASKDITIKAGALIPVSGNLTITPTANFQISLDSITWSSSPINIAYFNSGDSLSASKVKVKFNSPATLGLGYAGTVTVTGANIQVPGKVDLIANNMQTYSESSVSTTSTTDTIDIAKVTIANLAFGEANVTPITGRSTANKKYSDNRLAAPELILNAGSIYQYTVNTYTTGAAMPLCSLGVYIDYNADGDFSDVGESASTVAIPVANNGVVTGSLTVPTTAKIDTNNSPRIRFVLSTSTPSATGTTYSVGETEDYRVKISAAIPMVYVATTTEQVGKQIIAAGAANEKILKVKVTMNNSVTPLNLTNIVFNTNGTNPTSALSSARVYFTRDTATFNTNTPIAAATEGPNGAINFEAEGNITFKPGDNYLWLAYSIAADAGVDAIIDGELTGLYLSDAPTVNKITTPQAPEGISLVNRMKFDGTFDATAFSTNTANFPYNNWTVPTGTYPWTIRNIGRNNATACTPYLGSGMAELYGWMVDNTTRLLFSPSFTLNTTELPSTLSMRVYRTGTTGTTSLKVKINTTADTTGAITLNTISASPINAIPARISAEPVVASAGWYNYSFEIPQTYVPGANNYLILEGFGDYVNNIYVDEVKLGSDAYMAFAKTDTLNTGDIDFAKPSTNNVVNAFNVQTIASNNAYDITNIKFTPEGTTNLASISNAKVWYLGGTAVFNPATNKLFGTVATVASGQNTVVRTADSAAIKLVEGNNYFAITYDVPTNATVGAIVDCKVNSITLSRNGEATERIIANGNTWGTHEIKLPLSGTYTVGGTPLASRWYPTLVEAADEVSALGISANTEFAIAGDQVFTATQNPIFATVNNVGGNYTLTIYPKDAPRTITGNIAGTGVGVLTFAGADRVIVDGRVNKQGTDRGLTIINNDEGIDVHFAQSEAFGSTNTATVKFVDFKGKENTNSVNGIGLAFTGKAHSNITITNNQFSRISNGIWIQGADTLNKINTVLVSNNIFGNATEADRLRRNGVDVSNANDINITNNTFKGLGSTSTTFLSANPAAVNLGSGINNANVISNIINDMANYNTSGYGAYGVNISSNTAIYNVNIYSNSISKFICYGDGTSTVYSPFGIRIAGGSDIKVINNSIDFSGIYTGTGTGMSACFAITSTGTSIPRNLTVKNNIFSNGLTNAATTSKSYSIYAPTGTTFATINNNNYYVSGDRGVLAYFSADKTTLSAWRDSTGQDAGSVNTKVAFLSDSDMHLSGASACNTALNCPLASEVSSDIDGADRGNVTKMGVDEVNATFSITGQPVSTVSQCVTLGSNNTIDIPVGTFNVSTYSDGIARPFNAGDLEYSWTKNNEAIAGNSAPLKVLFSGTTLPTTNDVYKATVTFLNTSFTPTTLTLVEGPTVFTLTRTGTSPMTIGLNSSESGATYTLLRNSVEVANSSMVGTGQALAFGSFSEAGTYRIKSVKGSCETIMKDSAVIIQAGYTLSGTIKYANTAQTAMNNCIIIIKSGDLEVRRDTTDATGVYSVSGLANGTYSIEVLTTKVHGGINTFDITPIKQKLANIIELSPLKFKAADLNKSNSINTFDITPIKQKLANQVAPGWVASNYVFYPVSVTIASGNSTLDIQSLCSGDVNGSFVPSSGN